MHCSTRRRGNLNSPAVQQLSLQELALSAVSVSQNIFMKSLKMRYNTSAGAQERNVDLCAAGLPAQQQQLRWVQAGALPEGVRDVEAVADLIAALPLDDERELGSSS